jgi:hypothetical protein
VVEAVPGEALHVVERCQLLDFETRQGRPAGISAVGHNRHVSPYQRRGNWNWFGVGREAWSQGLSCITATARGGFTPESGRPVVSWAAEMGPLYSNRHS